MDYHIKMLNGLNAERINLHIREGQLPDQAAIDFMTQQNVIEEIVEWKTMKMAIDYQAHAVGSRVVQQPQADVLQLYSVPRTR